MSNPTTSVTVRADASTTSISVQVHEATEDRPRHVDVYATAHRVLRARTDDGYALWSASFTAPAASDLLALLAPVVKRLRAVAADELVAPPVCRMCGEWGYDSGICGSCAPERMCEVGR